MQNTSANSPSEWPRLYSDAELVIIARVIGCAELPPLAKDKLQEAVDAYQHGIIGDHFKGDPSPLFPSNHQRRQKLKRIIGLCKQRAKPHKIDEVFHGANGSDVEDAIDGITSQLLGNVDRRDLASLLTAAEHALTLIPRGMTPRRARLDFVRDLAIIYALVTGKLSGRSVHDQEQGRFLEFVHRALEPFDLSALHGVETDIRPALAEVKSRKLR